MKCQGLRPIEVRFRRGEPVTIWTAYYSRANPKKVRKSSRKSSQDGMRPDLISLGIYDRCSPCLAMEIVRMAVLLSSFAEAQKVLQESGVHVAVNTIRRIVYHLADRVRYHGRRRKSLEKTVAGRRVVISTDGGRIRTRQDKTTKTKKGRKHYETAWKEPKILTIYEVHEVDGEVKIDRTRKTTLDGTMGGAKELFILLESYLSQINLSQADAVLFVADGASWIWKRVGAMMKRLGLRKGQWHELTDFYHVVEHLAKATEGQKDWSEKERKKWISEQSERLKEGKVEEVVKALKELKKTSTNKANVQKEVKYVESRMKAGRLNYVKVSAAKLPIGSGAIESRMRQVVNLRLKGAGIFWHPKNAEAILLLRCYWKSDCTNLLQKLAFMPTLTSMI